jgi:stage V sporulation protein R
MFTDLKRMCEHPTEEDTRWFPEIAGSDWLETVHFAMRNFKDESFILQFLSPKVMRDLKLFCILDDDRNSTMNVTAIHDDEGYRAVREALSAHYNLGNREPNIQIYEVDVRGDRSLTLQHQQFNRQPLDESSQEVLKHIHRLWGFDVHLQSMSDNVVVQRFDCPPKESEKGR